MPKAGRSRLHQRLLLRTSEHHVYFSYDHERDLISVLFGTAHAGAAPPLGDDHTWRGLAAARVRATRPSGGRISSRNFYPHLLDPAPLVGRVWPSHQRGRGATRRGALS